LLWVRYELRAGLRAPVPRPAPGAARPSPARPGAVHPRRSAPVLCAVQCRAPHAARGGVRTGQASLVRDVEKEITELYEWVEATLEEMG